jgi:hypothetical protein
MGEDFLADLIHEVGRRNRAKHTYEIVPTSAEDRQRGVHKWTLLIDGEPHIAGPSKRWLRHIIRMRKRPITITIG